MDSEKFHILIDHPLNIFRTACIVFVLFLAPWTLLNYVPEVRPFPFSIFFFIGLFAYLLGRSVYYKHWISKGLKIGGLVNQFFSFAIFPKQVQIFNLLAYVLPEWTVGLMLWNWAIGWIYTALLVGILGSIFYLEPYN